MMLSENSSNGEIDYKDREHSIWHSLKDINDWTSKELLEEIIERLTKKKYDEIKCMIIAAREDDVKDIFLELFPALIMEYDESLENDEVSDPILKEILKFVKIYGSAKHRLLVLMECSFRVKSWKTFMMIGKFMEELIPDINAPETRVSSDITKEYIPSWIERFLRDIVENCEDDQCNENYFEILKADYMNTNDSLPSINRSPDSDDLFNEAVFMFLRLFNTSRSDDYKVLDELIDQVLACKYNKSDILETFIEEIDWMYRPSGRPLLNTLVLVNSLKSKSSAIPQIFSPEYRLQLAIKPLQHSLHVSTSNMYNVAYMVLVLRTYLGSIKNESIERNQIIFYLSFLGDFLICCEEHTLCNVRKICMDTFSLFLTKFEPIAQVLLIRKLFFMVHNCDIERKNLHKNSISGDGLLEYEQHLLAWLIDLFRFKLHHEAFRRELGFFWGDLASVAYTSFGSGLQFYTALFILAQQQALQKINPNLMLNIYNHYLKPMQPVISEWSEVVGLQNRDPENLQMPSENLPSNMEAATQEGYRQQELQSLPMIQFQYLQTVQFVEAFIGSAFVSTEGSSEKWY